MPDFIDHIVATHRSAIADARAVMHACNELPRFEARSEPRVAVTVEFEDGTRFAFATEPSEATE